MTSRFWFVFLILLLVSTSGCQMSTSVSEFPDRMSQNADSSAEESKAVSSEESPKEYSSIVDREQDSSSMATAGQSSSFESDALSESSSVIEESSVQESSVWESAPNTKITLAYVAISLGDPYYPSVEIDIADQETIDLMMAYLSAMEAQTIETDANAPASSAGFIQITVEKDNAATVYQLLTTIQNGKAEVYSGTEAKIEYDRRYYVDGGLWDVVQQYIDLGVYEFEIREYDKAVGGSVEFTCKTKPASVWVVSNRGAGEKIILSENTEYTYDSGAVTIQPNFLETLMPGSYACSFMDNSGREDGRSVRSASLIVF
ncbi:MAG: hypothetical protein LBM69_00660 [Lachnospiraceae bacterium]|jgi:hypothetical protein|nr:hypothetical protein [Lachnospiraceae bacterium]